MKKSDLQKELIETLAKVLKAQKKKESGVRNEFRFNFDTRHPNFVFEEKNGKYISLGLTHEERTFGKRNMSLKNNPKKGGMEKSYVRNGVIVGKKRSYGKRTIKNMQFSKEDAANVKSKIRNYKKGRKKRK
ncbi:MAG: hypothetical protein J6C93_07730 [Clostridia bacterium]|nr:hypothetical protein [Clostridia bacterium]